MSIVALTDSLVMQPLLLIYGALWSGLLAATDSPALAVMLLGIVVNVAMTPAYLAMERSNRAARAHMAKMRAEEARMKRHFRGRELYYYLRAVHRQFGFRPHQVLFQSSELLIQLLIFASAYRFLSGHPTLAYSDFLGLMTLGHPDGLLFGANLLPFVMTAANVASVMLYTSDKAQRRQGWILAVVFLVLLYRSPAGLLLYWTANNLFSLGRNMTMNQLKGEEAQAWQRRWQRLLDQE